MEIAYTLCLPRDELSVPIIRRICRDTLLALGVGRDCVSDIEVAVTEACTNVLRHASSEHEDYEVEVRVDPGKVAVSIIDSGAGFDHSVEREVAPPAAESGRGILLMQALVDRLHFVSRPKAGTVVHLEKVLILDDDSVLKKLASVA